jgi:hypothetical protein
VFAIRLRFLVALAVVAVGLVAAIVVPPIVRSINAQDARANLAAANAAFKHLKVPPEFGPLPAGQARYVCPSAAGQPTLCYYAAEPTTTVSKGALLAILRSVGGQYDARDSRCWTIRVPGGPSKRSCWIYGRVDSLYVFAGLRAYVPFPCDMECRREANRSELTVFPPFTPSTN